MKTSTGSPAVNSPSYWDELYRRGEAHWDLGSDTPAFVDLLDSGEAAPGKTLVLGCGKGYDAVLFARRGFAVTAVDFSGEAVVHARGLADSGGVAVEFLQADLFNLPSEFAGAFDYVVEYVTFCAIDPLRRREYVDVVQRCLKPGGRFLALFFPIEVRSGGPPFAVPLKETIRLFEERLDLVSLEFPQKSIPPRKGREVMTVWLKK